MILLPLLVCVLLGALSAQAEVVETFDDCNEFFYRRTEPAGMDQNTKKICQKLNKKYHYFTLYSTHHRIPVYSAYTFKSEKKGTSKSREKDTSESRTSLWFIEPQLDKLSRNDPGWETRRPTQVQLNKLSRYDPGWETRRRTQVQIPIEHSDDMTGESEYIRNGMKELQAINSDYNKTGYDRGHLMPNSYGSGDEGRKATFTLTNAAPMHPCFNQLYWSRWEKGVKEFLNKNTESTVYLVTGTVPHSNKRIPQREESAQEQSSNKYERVTVPTHIWTAVCYPGDKEKSFSFGYIGQNVAETNITMMPVSVLNSELARLCRESGIKQAVCNPRIFVDECDFSSGKYEEIIEYLKNTIQLTSFQHINNFIQMPAKSTCSETSDCRKRAYSSMDEFSKDSENMKRKKIISCVLTDVVRKRDLFQNSDAVKCQQVTEKSDPTAMTAADGTRCQNSKRFCETKDGFKPCCSTPCLYQETRKDYWCRSGQIEIQCSPQYSSITVNGEKCKDDHQCGTYGKDYYWCKTSSSWNYCSPPLWKSKAIDQKDCLRNHACAKYGKSYTWCYTDFDNNWNYCCNHDDCYSARDGKTCKSDHKCGYHGKDYLWCYTTDGSWAECCTPCQ